MRKRFLYTPKTFRSLAVIKTVHKSTQSSVPRFYFKYESSNFLGFTVHVNWISADTGTVCQPRVTVT